MINGSSGTITNFIENNDLIDGIAIKYNQISDSKIIFKHEVHTYKLYEGKTIKIIQFPLKMCWACAAHKAQGQTLNKVVISFKDVAFALGFFCCFVPYMKNR